MLSLTKLYATALHRQLRLAKVAPRKGDTVSFRLKLPQSEGPGRFFKFRIRAVRHPKVYLSGMYCSFDINTGEQLTPRLSVALVPGVYSIIFDDGALAVAYAKLGLASRKSCFIRSFKRKKARVARKAAI
jgi:hypothetical protein